MGIVRKTKSVDLILDLFNKNVNAFSVVHLVKLTEKQMNKTTVYRILDRLEEEGIIHSFNDTNGLRWYAKCKGCTPKSHLDTHPHFQCSSCGTIECLDVSVIIPAIKDHKVYTAEIILVGECNTCLTR
ncbi:MAG: transcriptional repressor [Flavobacteriaceae bacterium]|nr:transcriptional repressor [Flavobacteriaceae bacterium]